MEMIRATSLEATAKFLTLLSEDIHQENKLWWTDLHTGEPIKRNVPEMIALMHSELSEALEGHRKNLMDDKLQHRKAVEVEMADLFIRAFDFCGGLGLDIGGALAEKLVYNRTRTDHTIEARKAGNGKQY